ncbi:frequency clock protein [Phaeosphaeriaceae sp. PMI808]|nr:frequency clock protein [Phaeosphaeriaceae sp. PMI808]
MHDPPGIMPRNFTQSHPRRPPAHNSVSLRHGPLRGDRSLDAKILQAEPTAMSFPNPASDETNPPSVSPHLFSHKNSSGESSDTSKWFETTNNNARQRSASFADNEPPFFLRNSSSSETPPDAYSGPHIHVHSNMPYRPNLARNNTNGSSIEDFRSVIDDLTIMNKKLKRRLRKYERVHDSHHQADKLFEVRFHGLPDHKKKELEDTLRKFTNELADGATTDLPQVSSYAPPLEQKNIESSTSRFAESGYVSMSASGQNSSAPSNQASNPENDTHTMSRSAYNRQQQSIQSYLHNIPAGVRSRSNIPMSDKSKKKLVVRRLEQIYAGKRSVSGSHPQPMQQEEVAQSAATADREEQAATGRNYRPEGLRIARIMPEHDSHRDASPGEVPQRLRTDLHIEQQHFDNMDTGDAPQDGHGWLYLNLLINMAQLHTLNVTTNFVKDALTEYSSQLELSRDGRKIRWKGGLEETKNCVDSTSEHCSGNSPPEYGSPSKHLNMEDSEITDEAQLGPEQKAKILARADREREMSKFAYTPIFFRKESSSEEDEFDDFDVEMFGASLHPPQHNGTWSGFGSSAVQGGSSSRKHDDGPMIFYNKAKFCTDLSGDRLRSSLFAPGAYTAINSRPLGALTRPTQTAPRSTSDLGEARGPLGASPKDIISDSGDNVPSTVSSSDEFNFSPPALRTDSSSENSSAELMDFQVSGLGGVQPDDNFCIHVRRSQTQSTSSQPFPQRRSRLYPKKILKALNATCSPKAGSTSPSRSQRIIREKVLSTSCKLLPSSTLPPASFLPFDSASSYDVDSDLDADVSSEADSESREGSTTALQLSNVSPRPDYSNEEDSGEEFENSDKSDNGSIDMLVTAGQFNPRMVRVQEREYDAALADRLAYNIMAGSSAATAGGGSGFNSPMCAPKAPSYEGSLQKKRQSTTSGSMSSRTRLKRSRTSESVDQKGRSKGSKSQKITVCMT